MVRRVAVVVLFLFCSGLLVGCQTCPEVERIDASAGAPALVQVLFSVRCDGVPVTDITVDDINLKEGGAEVSGTEGEWLVEPHRAALETYTLLLIDVSTSILVDPDTLATARLVAVDFASALVADNQYVAVGIFDGDAEVRTLVDFTQSVDTLTTGIEGIGPEDQLDGSTNLNGAVHQGIELLDAQVTPDVEGELMSVGSLVLFTDGVDRANRQTSASARRAVSSSDHSVFVVGLVGEDAIDDLEALGRDGFFQAEEPDDLVSAFGSLTSSLVSEANKYYRLSYCSPLRQPRTSLKIEVSYEDQQGSVSYSYKTDEFGPNCSLSTR